MTRQVKLTSRAELQLYDSALWWAENRSTEQAIRWMDSSKQRVRDLQRTPTNGARTGKRSSAI